MLKAFGLLKYFLKNNEQNHSNKIDFCEFQILSELAYNIVSITTFRKIS